MKTLKERNSEWYNVLFDLFKIKKNGNSWEEIGKQITLEKISLAYKAFADIFPRDVNYYNLLPEKESKFRSLMFADLTGNSIINYTTRYSLYSDEILVLHPLQNPALTNPDLSPIGNPRLWLVDFLNSLYFYLLIYDWVRSDIIQLILNPILYDSDPETRNAIYEIAEERVSKIEHLFRQKDVQKLTLKLLMDNLSITLGKMSTVKIKDSLKVIMKGESKNQIKIWSKYIKDNFERINPLSKFVNLEPGDEIQPSKQGANLEEILLISEITNSHLYSPSKISNISFQSLSDVDFWTRFAIPYSQLSLPYLNNIELNFALQIRQDEKLDGVRKELRRVSSEIEKMKIEEFNEKYFTEFMGNFKHETKIAEEKLKSIKDTAQRATLVAISVGLGALLIALPSPATVPFLPAVPTALKLLIDKIYTDKELQRAKNLNPFTIFAELKTPEPNIFKDIKNSIF